MPGNSGLRVEMSSEEVFRPGMRVESAIQEFRDRVNRRETISSWERRDIRKLLLRVQPLLADPITADQAQALEDAFRGRPQRIEDLIEWLQSPPMRWDQFPAFQQEQENLRREQLWQEWKTLEELRGDQPDKPEFCPSCGSRSVVGIAYGLPNEIGQEAARRGAITLGGCMIFDDAPKWHCDDCEHAWGELFGDPELLDDRT